MEGNFVSTSGYKKEKTRRQEVLRFLLAGKIFFIDEKVGVTGFEPAASSSRTKRATGLRYTPKSLLWSARTFFGLQKYDSLLKVQFNF